MKYIAVVLSICASTLHAQTMQTLTIPVSELPCGAVFLPSPPDSASSKYAYDIAQYEWGKSVRNTARGDRAAKEAIADTKDLAVCFSSPLGIEVSPSATPYIYSLIDCCLVNAGNASRLTKGQYMRKRPYVEFGESTNIPEDEESHRNSGSYPSSHTTIAWATALVMAEMAPERQDTLLSYAYEFGQSRVIAGYHYQSDVDAGRLIGSAVVARLHADEAFRTLVTRAKEEWDRVKP